MMSILMTSALAFGGMNDSTVNMFKLLCTGDNCVMSPYSSNKALELLRDGVQDQTLQKIQTALAGQNLETSHTNEGTTIRVANALWTDPLLHVKPAFVAKIAEVGSTESVPMQKHPDQAAAVINKWAAEKTEGLIPRLVTPAEIQSSLAALANALYVKARWLAGDRKLQTENLTFNGNANTPFLVHSAKDLNYFNGDGVQLVEIPFFGGSVQIGFVMPDKDFAGWKSAMTSEKLSKLMKQAKDTNVEVHHPAMSIKSEFQLLEAWSSLGLASLFKINPDFAPITDQPMFIGSAKQQSVFKLDEKGVEAAAVTIVEMRAGSAFREPKKPLKVVIDKPFLFYLSTRENKQILFLGQYVKP